MNSYSTKGWTQDTTYKGGPLHYDSLDGKLIAYSDETVFLIQVGKGKGSYRTKYVIRGDIGKAVLYYNGINIGLGHKKRLLMPSSSHQPILARATS